MLLCNWLKPDPFHPGWPDLPGLALLLRRDWRIYHWLQPYWAALLVAGWNGRRLCPIHLGLDHTITLSFAP
jgi:hypothetical protein